MVDSCITSFKTWNPLGTRAVSPLASFQLASSISPHPSVLANARSSAEHVAGSRIGNDVTEKKIVVRPLYPQNYRRENVWFTISHDAKVQNLLHAVLPNHEMSLLESLRAHKYQYDAGVRTLADLASRKFESIIFESALHHRGKAHCLKDKILLTAVDGCQRSLCTEKLVTS